MPACAPSYVRPGARSPARADRGADRDRPRRCSRCGKPSCAIKGIPPYVLPAPSAIAASLWTDGPSLLGSLLVTLRITLAALAAAALFGGAIALLFSRSRLLEISLFPYAVILQVTPIVAIAPLIIIWVKRAVSGAPGLRLDRRVLSDRVEHDGRAEQRRPQPAGAVPAVRRLAGADAALPAHPDRAALFPRRACGSAAGWR